MKWVLLITAAFCISGGFAEVRAEDAAADRSSGNDRTLQEDYEPWEIGTHVYYEFEEGWFTGKIVAFDSETGEYEILWSDGDAESYDDYDLVDEMVDNFSTEVRDYEDADCDDAWPDDTDIYVIEDGRGWWGKITQCEAGVYTTTWENGDVGYYNEGPDFDMMVTDAQDVSNNEDPEDNFDSAAADHDFTEQTYDEGTVVYKEFDDGWYEGEVVSFQNDMYSVRWSDGDVEYYSDGDEMDQMVADAVNISDKEEGAGLPTPYDDDYEPWEIGTHVYYEFEEGWFTGKIVAFDSETGEYEILWSDGDAESYDDYDLVDEMVDNFSTEVRDYEDADCDDAWPDGTDIYVIEDDRGWWGKITQCQVGVYTTTWENGDVGYYSEGPDFDKMVTDAQDVSNNEDPEDNFDSESAAHDFTAQTYDEGTLVYKQFDGKWNEGEILSFQNDMYRVRWSDGELDDYPEGDEMDQMVADGVNVVGKEEQAGGLPRASYGNDSKSGGFVFSMFLLIACVGAVAFWVVRGNRKKKLAARQGNFEGGFQDEPLEHREIS